MSFHRIAGSFLFLLFMMVACSLPAWGQINPSARNTYTVTGVVSDDGDDRRLAEVRVELKTTSAESVIMATTDGSGRFELNTIPAGEYVIELTLPGYESLREPVTVVNSTLRGLSFPMRKLADAASTNAASVVSAHELSVPHKAHDEYEKGIDLMYSKSDYQGAIGQFQRAIKDYPDFYEAYAKLGSAYVGLRQLPDAEKSFRKSVELSAEKYPEALFLLAGLLNNTNRSAEAESLCRKGIAMDGSSALGHFEFARALAAQNKLDEAEKNMLQARDMNPGNYQVCLFLANIHIQKHDYPAALKDLGDYLKLDPSSPAADQARKTQALLQAAVQKNPPSPQSSAAQPAKNKQPKAKKQSAPDDRGNADSGDDDAPSLMGTPSLGRQ